MKAALVGIATGLVAGAVAMGALLVLASAALGMHMTNVGVLFLAIPGVLIPALCGGIAALLFRRFRPSRPKAVVGLAGLYLALGWLFNFTLATLIRSGRLSLGGESWLGAPILLLGCWLIGALVMVPAALVIRRATIPARNRAAA